MSVAPEPVRARLPGWQDILDRARAGREEAPQLLRALATPWLLLLAVPALAFAARYAPPETMHPHLLLAPLVFAAARRWGLDSVRPTLILCLTQILALPSLGWPANLWNIPLMLAACRFGIEPSHFEWIAHRRHLAMADGLLLACVLISPFVGIIGFRYDFEIWLNPGKSVLFLLFGVLGATRVRFRTMLPFIIGGVAAFWLLAPLKPGVIGSYLSYRFGILPFEGVACCLAFAAGRVLTRPAFDPSLYKGIPHASSLEWRAQVMIGRSRLLLLAALATFVWFGLFVLAAIPIDTEIPLGPFAYDLKVLLLGEPAPVAFAAGYYPLLSPEIIVIQSILAWRLASIAAAAFGRRGKVLGILGLSIMLYAAIPVTEAVADWLRQGEYVGLWSLLNRPDEIVRAQLYRRAIALLLPALLFVVVTNWRFGPALAVPANSAGTDGEERKSLVLAVLGRVWPIALPAQLFCLAALSVGIALGEAQKIGETLGNQAQTNEADQIVANAEAMADNLDAQADAVRDAGENAADAIESGSDASPSNPSPRDGKRRNAGRRQPAPVQQRPPVQQSTAPDYGNTTGM